MSRTRKRVMVAGVIVLVLVCGIAAILLTSRESHEFTITFQGFETNSAGIISADLMLTNYSRSIWSVSVFVESKGPSGWTGSGVRSVRVAPHAGRGYAVRLPTQRPCKIIAHAFSAYPDSPDTISGRAKLYWHQGLRRLRPHPTFTLDLPE